MCAQRSTGGGTDLYANAMRLLKFLPVHRLVPNVSKVLKGGIKLVLLHSEHEASRSLAGTPLIYCLLELPADLAGDGCVKAVPHLDFPSGNVAPKELLPVH